MKEIWETHYLGDTRTLDVHIRWLRERIEVAPTRPALLVTQRGVGYKLVVPGIAALDPVSFEEEPLEIDA
jgi:DNA-binding response OmpR family regulator